MGLKKIKKVYKSAFWDLLRLLDLLVCTRKSFKNFEALSYMTTYVSYISTKFTNGATNLPELIAPAVGQSVDFWYFKRKNFFVT